MKGSIAIAMGAALFAGAASLPLQAAAKAARHSFEGRLQGAAQRARPAGLQRQLEQRLHDARVPPRRHQGRRPTPRKKPGRLEKIDTQAAEESDKPIDPSVGLPKVGGDAPIPGTRPEFVAAGGGTGGYDRGWLDPGNGFMRVNGEARTSIITTPDGRAPKMINGKTEPVRPPGLGGFDNPEDRTLGDRCLQFGRNAPAPMMGNGFYNNDYQIVQTKDEVAIYVEVIHDVRHIRLNGKHRTDGVRTWMGDSIGHYEGDTLVVETINLPKQQAYHGSWENLVVTERFTRKGPDRLHYAYTIHDPTTWAQDWGGEYEFHPLKGQLYEYACHEGNYALEHILAGAREEEKRVKVASRGE